MTIAKARTAVVVEERIVVEDVITKNLESGGRRESRERQDHQRARKSTEEDGSRPSGARQPRGFDEDFELDVVFDEEMKVASFVVTTTGGVCVMDAKYPEGRSATTMLRPRVPVATTMDARQR